MSVLSTADPRAVRQREIAYFDGFVTSHGEFNPFTAATWRLLAQRFAAWVPAASRLELLDIGCGTGASRAIYEDRFTQYTGADLSERAISAARAKYPADTWLVADATRLPFAADSFDVVAFSSVLHHIPDFSQAIREAVRVVRPGGYVFAYDPNALHPGICLLRHPRSPLYLREGVSPDECPMLPRTLRVAFRSAGLIDLRQRAQSGLEYRAVAHRTINRCLHLLNFMDRIWDAIGFGRTFGSFVLTCGRRRMT